MMLLFTFAQALAEEEPVPGFTLKEIWIHSGNVARVVIVLLLVMLLASVVITIERWLAFRTATLQSKDIAARIVPHLQKGDVNRALAMTKEESYKSSYLAALLRGGLAELSLRLDTTGISNAHRSVNKVANQELSKLRRGMPILATVASTSPFVGLAGTTFGVINAFQGMATAGAGLAGVSAGISEALITTFIGIVVAVWGVWMFNYFNNRLDKVSEELSSSEADFLDWAEKQIQDPPTAEAAK